MSRSIRYFTLMALLVLQQGCVLKRVARIFHRPAASNRNAGTASPPLTPEKPQAPPTPNIVQPTSEAVTTAPDKAGAATNSPPIETVSDKPILPGPLVTLESRAAVELERRRMRIEEYLQEAENNVGTAEKKELSLASHQIIRDIRSLIVQSRDLETSDLDKSEPLAEKAVVLSRAEFKKFISKSVGRDAGNIRIDVLLVIELFRKRQRIDGGAAPIENDGPLSLELLTAEIATFQSEVVGLHDPDARIDPGGPTFRTLIGESVPKQQEQTLAHPPSSPKPGPGRQSSPLPLPPPQSSPPNPIGGSPSRTKGPIEWKATPATVDVVLTAIAHEWPDMTTAGKHLLAAQFMHETKEGKSLYNWNVGNLKWSGEPNYAIYDIVWECETPSNAAIDIAADKEHARLPTEAQFRANKNNWRCGVDKKTGIQKIVILFYKPHRQCWFNAFPDIDAGVNCWVKHHRATGERYKLYIGAIQSGDVRVFATTMQDRGYFTGDLESYIKKLESYKNDLDKRFK